MENEIKELIEKLQTKRLDSIATYGKHAIEAGILKPIINELDSLLELYRSQQEVAPESIGMEQKKDHQENCCGNFVIAAYNRGYDDGFVQAKLDLMGREVKNETTKNKTETV